MPKAEHMLTNKLYMIYVFLLNSDPFPIQQIWGSYLPCKRIKMLATSERRHAKTTRSITVLGLSDSITTAVISHTSSMLGVIMFVEQKIS